MKKPRYNWRTSQKMYDILCKLLATKGDKISVFELANRLEQGGKSKDKRSTSEQVNIMIKEGILDYEKPGRTKFIWVNTNWLIENIGKNSPDALLYQCKTIDELITRIKQYKELKQSIRIPLEQYAIVRTIQEELNHELFQKVENLENEYKKILYAAELEITNLKNENKELKNKIKGLTA